MYNEQLEQLIDAALADGELTEKEKQILFKKAQAMGVDLDEFEMVLDARLVKMKKAEEEKAASSAPKSNKLGDVKKCPSCGAMVQSYQGVCPECGYAFEGVDANSAVKELSSLLQKESDPKKMEKIIDSYPIPMDKAALLAFVTWLRPQSIDINHPLANSYYKKYSECINKIRVSFANDKQLQQFIEYFESDEKSIKKQKMVNFTLKNIWFWCGVIVLFVLFLIFKPTPTHKSVEKSNIAIQEALENGDTKKAINIFLKFKGKGGKRKKKSQQNEFRFGGASETIVDACLAENNFKDAQRVANVVGIEYGNPFTNTQAALASKLYEYCISHGDFETAKNIIYSYADYKYQGTYIRDVVTYLCEHGEKEEAQRFLNANCVGISYLDELCISEIRTDEKATKYVKKMIQDIINKY